MPDNYVTLSHDGFARCSTVRKQEDRSGDGCAWCGGVNGRGKLFRYGTARDDRPGRPDFDRKLFCSRGCYESYHG